MIKVLILFLFFSLCTLSFSRTISKINIPIEQTYHKGERIFSIATSPDEKNLFFGNSSGLIVYDDNKLKRVFSESDGLIGEFVNKLVIFDNVLYGSTYSLIGKSCLFSYSNSAGLTVWPEDKSKIINITSILRLDNEHIILTTFNGEVWTMDIKNNSFKKIFYKKNLNIISATKYKDSIYLACKYTGILQIGASIPSIETQKVLKEYNEHSSHLINNNINSICHDDSGLWIGSQSGGNYFNTSENTWKSYWGKQLSDDFVSTIYPDNYFIWFGTGNGISILYKKKGLWCSFNNTNGLNGKIILDIKASNKSIFIASEQGVFKIIKATFYNKMEK